MSSLYSFMGYLVITAAVVPLTFADSRLLIETELGLTSGCFGGDLFLLKWNKSSLLLVPYLPTKRCCGLLKF